MSRPLLDADAVAARLGVSRTEALKVMRAAGAFRVSRLVVRDDMLTPRADEVDRRVVAAVPVSGRGVTQAELVARVGVSQPRVAEALRRLEARGRVRRRGRGSRVQPYRFKRPASDLPAG